MIKVNLLSPEKKDVTGGAESPIITDEVREAKINIPAVVGATAVVLVVIAFLYFTQSARLDSKTQYLAERRARKTELDNVLKTLANLEKTKADLDRKVKIIGDLKARQKQTVLMMDELSRVLPDWVWLTKLSFSNGVLNIAGKALTNNLIADFINNMQSTNHFTNIRLNSTQRQRSRGQDVFNFSINCQYNKVLDDKAV